MSTEIELQQTSSEISQKIKSLCDFDGESLKYEMQDLKKSLLENPAACSLLMDEDIGLAVAALRRMTGTAIAIASQPKEKKPKEKKSSTKLTPAELAAALADVSDEDL